MKVRIVGYDDGHIFDRYFTDIIFCEIPKIEQNIEYFKVDNQEIPISFNYLNPELCSDEIKTFCYYLLNDKISEMYIYKEDNLLIRGKYQIEDISLKDKKISGSIFGNKIKPRDILRQYYGIGGFVLAVFDRRISAIPNISENLKYEIIPAQDVDYNELSGSDILIPLARYFNCFIVNLQGTLKLINKAAGEVKAVQLYYIGFQKKTVEYIPKNVFSIKITKTLPEIVKMGKPEDLFYTIWHTEYNYVLINNIRFEITNFMGLSQANMNYIILKNNDGIELPETGEMIYFTDGSGTTNSKFYTRDDFTIETPEIEWEETPSEISGIIKVDEKQIDEFMFEGLYRGELSIGDQFFFSDKRLIIVNTKIDPTINEEKWHKITAIEVGVL